LPKEARLTVAGLVLVRQRPGSAKGVIFTTLEDEEAVANVVIWPDVFEANRTVVLKSSLLGVEGRLQREGAVIHVVAERIFDLTPMLAELKPVPGEASADTAAEFPRGRDIVIPLLDNPLARADEVKRPTIDQRGIDPRKGPAKYRGRGAGPATKDRLFPSRDFH
ncbi:MAG: OB-fold nucleic acid binding domain-containing protein, partial [Rhodovibrionaceae bacterium]|nr:OB-fold nucleic acid binding domain-containing protein [Rhodovibrionaceae bacterium]